jgi:hypothetical protein
MHTSRKIAGKNRVTGERPMANPNRVAAYLPKNPYEYVARSRSQTEMEQVVADLKAQGFDAKLTRVKVGPRKGGWFEYNAWKRNRRDA